jgi:hypothetical protein
MQTGLAPAGTRVIASQAFGHKVWAIHFTLLYGQTYIITLVWHVPQAVTQDSNGWHYQYLIQRQAGAQWMMHLLITLPSCAVTSNILGNLKPINKYTAILAQPLEDDSMVGVDYTC